MIQSRKFSSLLAAAVCVALTTSACMKGPGFLKQSGSEEQGAVENILIVPTTIDGEFATGTVFAELADTQVVEAAPESSVAGSEAVFPPGSLAVDTSVTIGPGQNFVDDGVVSDLGLGIGVEQSANSVAVASSDSSDAVLPFTIALPMPSSSALVAGDDPLANLVVIYKIFKASQGGEFTGVMLRKDLTIDGNFIRLSTLYFGTYQAVITALPITEAFEKPVPPKAVSLKTLFRPGFVTTSFGNSVPEQDGFRGWFHHITKARVGSASILTLDVLARPVSGE